MILVRSAPTSRSRSFSLARPSDSERSAPIPPCRTPPRATAARAWKRVARDKEPFALLVAQLAYERVGGPELAYRFVQFGEQARCWTARD